LDFCDEHETVFWKGMSCEKCLEEEHRTDARSGMTWWNGLTERERAEWMARADNTGVAADAWAEFKRAADQPTGDA